MSRPVVIVWPADTPEALCYFASDGRHFEHGDLRHLSDAEFDAAWAAFDVAEEWGRCPTDPLPAGWRFARASDGVEVVFSH